MKRKYPPVTVGAKYGEWTVIGDCFFTGEKSSRRRMWPSRCSCGKEQPVPDGNLKQGLSTQCRACAVRHLRLSGNDTKTHDLWLGFAKKNIESMSDNHLQEAAQLVAKCQEKRKQKNPPQKACPRTTLPAPRDTQGRALPESTTDWDLFDDLVKVHKSVTDELAWSRDLYDWWAAWNRIYFAEKLKPLFIYSGNTDYGKFLGLCRYLPTREILIQKQGIKSPEKGEHHGYSVRHHEAFGHLTDTQYNVALIVLHEMIHQACFEAGVDPNHEGAPWAAHCNYIGNDLGLGLTFSEMRRSKVTIQQENNSKSRVNIWRPKKRIDLLPNTDRFATVEECRCFPFRDGDPFIGANTVTLTSGKAVKQNGGRPVVIPPKF